MSLCEPPNAALRATVGHFSSKKSINYAIDYIYYYKIKAGKYSIKLDEETAATIDKVLEYEVITPTQHRKNLLSFILM